MCARIQRHKQIEAQARMTDQPTMPRHYNFQDLIRLGHPIAYDREGLSRLPDGRIVCGPHGRVVCGECCADYVDYNRTHGHFDVHTTPRVSGDRTAMIRGSGLAFAGKFSPPNNSQTPALELFSGRHGHMGVLRYTLPDDKSTLLLVTNGACPNNGSYGAKAGWAFVEGLDAEGVPIVASGRLEQRGPWASASSAPSPQTNNRAELRAVIAALRSRFWPAEGFRTVVVATDSDHVVQGSVLGASTWVRNGWRTARGTGGSRDVQNKDLWEALLGEFERYERYGLAVFMWKVSRESTALADAAAKRAAANEIAPEVWTE